MGEVENIKQRSTRDSTKEVSGRGDRDRERHREKEKARDRVSARSDRDRESQRSEKDREKERSDDEKYRERRDRDSRHQDRERKTRDRDKEKERDREDRDRDKERDKERAREREEREDREKDRARRRDEREREREREDRERERERERAREERVRDREREKVREKRRVLERDEEEDGRDHERKRRRREESHERERERSNRHREGSADVHRKGDDNEAEAKEKKSREQDLEEEQRKLDEEMDKRRRRVQEWQELKRKKEEQEREKDGKVNGEELNQTGKNWTLDGESDDEEADAVKYDNDADGDAMAIDVGSKQNDANSDVMDVNSETRVVSNGVEGADGEDDIDPLDAFMNSMVLPEVEKLQSVETAQVKTADSKLGSQERTMEVLSNGVQAKKGVKNPLGRILPDEDSAPEDGDLGNEEIPSEDEDDEDFMKRVKKTKAERLSIVDHSKIQYPPFRKNFYIEVKEIAKMTADDVAAYRKQLELKVHGKDIPKPIKTWNQTGLASKILDTIKKLNFEKPMPIQAQALPIIMSGRDCIGIAKTGSGKTLAFVLPMLRHIKDQPPVVPGDGPIALIMAPTRELVQQIHSDIKRFSKVLGFNCVPVYGGSGVAQQISELKRGAEIVVCTLGRIRDIL